MFEQAILQFDTITNTTSINHFNKKKKTVIETEKTDLNTKKSTQLLQEVDLIRERFGVQKFMNVSCLRELLELPTALAS